MIIFALSPPFRRHQTSALTKCQHFRSERYKNHSHVPPTPYWTRPRIGPRIGPRPRID